MTLLEGKPIAKSLSESLKNRVEALIQKNGKTPKLVAVNLGDDSASEWYNKSIEKACGKVGIHFDLSSHPDIKSEDAVAIIQKLNQDDNIHGILINQPLPDHLKGITNHLSPEKDIEGITAENLGKLMLNEKTHIPCTPLAVMTIIDEYKINLSGLNIAMIGRSNIVGKPLSILLTQRNATVTLCHSKTKNLEELLKSSDVIVAAIGRSKFVKGDWVKEGAIVIDVGTNYSDTGLVGDVDFETAKEKASQITPVPGGVGSLTNVLLLQNCVDAYIEQLNL